MSGAPHEPAPPDPDEVEAELLVSAIHTCYDVDLREYAAASLGHRLRQAARQAGVGSVGELIPRVVRDRAFFTSLLGEIAATTTAMFRDPQVYLALRREVLPLLAARPRLAIWHVGCSSGEEVYSLAILLKEAGLYERCRIEATDISRKALATTEAGIYPVQALRAYTMSYQAAGGCNDFSRYYTAAYGHALMDRGLLARVTFSQHELPRVAPTGPFDLILCRNVLIYFQRQLQERVAALLAARLSSPGVLCLGLKETLTGLAVAAEFSEFRAGTRIFRRCAHLTHPETG